MSNSDLYYFSPQKMIDFCPPQLQVETYIYLCPDSLVVCLNVCRSRSELREREPCRAYSSASPPSCSDLSFSKVFDVACALQFFLKRKRKNNFQPETERAEIYNFLGKKIIKSIIWQPVGWLAWLVRYKLSN